MALYNGFASPSETPDVKMCQLTDDNREFKSKMFRVVVRLPLYLYYPVYIPLALFNEVNRHSQVTAWMGDCFTDR